MTLVTPLPEEGVQQQERAEGDLEAHLLSLRLTHRRPRGCRVGGTLRIYGNLSETISIERWRHMVIMDNCPKM